MRLLEIELGNFRHGDKKYVQAELMRFSQHIPDLNLL